ncbi:hypothetical protein [Streptomyces longisporus]
MTRRERHAVARQGHRATVRLTHHAANRHERLTIARQGHRAADGEPTAP